MPDLLLCPVLPPAPLHTPVSIMSEIPQDSSNVVILLQPTAIVFIAVHPTFQGLDRVFTCTMNMLSSDHSELP